MLKWLKPRHAPEVRAAQRTEEEWRCADQLSLFLVVRHHHMSAIADWRSSLEVSTYNSLTKAGFADGWTLPLRGGPRRHPLLDGGTISEFVRFERNVRSRHLAQIEVKEAYAWDLHYRSDIYATGVSFCLALQTEAMAALTEKARAGEFNWMGDSILCSFVVRVPVRREFAFPEPRATEKPYSDGPAPQPLREVGRFSADWIEVASLDSKRMYDEPAEDLPISDLFADEGPIRLY